MSIEIAVLWAATVMEVAGVGAILVGAVVATLRYVARLGAQAVGASAYHDYRQTLGRAILLGLEFLVAADIIRTVAVHPTFTSAGVLAVIVLIRTLLSMSLQVELEHRWPWQGAEARASGAGARAAPAVAPE